MTLDLRIIAAVAQNRVIGNKGVIPWHIPGDLPRFKELTMGKPVIMGRLTYESILPYTKGKPLPGRTNIVISSRGREGPLSSAHHVVSNLFDALRVAEESSEIAYCIGGERVYSQTISLPHTTHLEITEIKKEYEGDAYFPHIDPAVWSRNLLDDKEGYAFVQYRRIVNHEQERTVY